MKYDICVFGGCSCDCIYYMDEDEYYNNKPDKISPGGKASNQAVAAARAGSKVSIITRVGNDESKDIIIKNLKDNNIDISNIEIDENIESDRSELYVKHDDKDYDIKRFSAAIDNFYPEMVEKYSDVLLSSKIVVAQLKAPKEVSIQLINFCYKNHIPLVITPCHPEKMSVNDAENKELIDKITYITCNEKECQKMFETIDIASCVEKYPNKLIVTLGEDGLIYHNGKELVHLEVPVKVKVEDTIGAGDTLCGYFANYISQNVDFESALYKAQIAAVMAVRSKTAQEGIPYANEVEEFMENNKLNYK